MNPTFKVFLVDDCHSLCEALRFLFKTIPHVELSIYSRASDFLNDFPLKTPGILLIDLLMPETNGLMLLDELKQRQHALHIIVMSAHTDQSILQTAQEKGAHEFLPKPFNVDYLLNKINLMVDELNLSNKHAS